MPLFNSVSATQFTDPLSTFCRAAASTAVIAMAPPHALFVTLSNQSHINPGLQLAKRLILHRINVTMAIAVRCQRRMVGALAMDGLSFVTFSDGYDDGLKPEVDLKQYMSEIERHSLEALPNIITSAADEGRPFTCVVYSLLMPWVAEVAREFHLPSVFLWNQPAAVLGIYYHYFHGYEEIISDNINDPSWSIELPGLPLFSASDLPPFLVPSDVPNFAMPGFRRHFEELEKEENPTVLVNSFEELEKQAFKSIEKLNLIPVGPLIPSAFLTGDDPSDTSFGFDLFRDKKDLYMEWLSSMPSRSVIYVAFGSIRSVTKQQLEEIAAGLLKFNRPFLWVITNAKDKGDSEDESEELSCRKELEKLGKIVPWCSQVEVLSSSSVGGFFSHCGWNSTLESLIAGVPMLAFPHWSDQFTNAKLIEDEWRCGVRVKTNGDGVAEGEEIRRCLEMVMGEGERAEEMKANAGKWKELGKKAAIGGGSSDKKTKDFVDQFCRQHHRQK